MGVHIFISIFRRFKAEIIRFSGYRTEILTFEFDVHFTFQNKLCKVIATINKYYVI